MRLQPTLVSNLVRLQPLAPEDFDALYEVANDPLIWEQAFRSVGTIHFHVGHENLRSRRALEKIGATLIGESEVHGQIRLIYKIEGPGDPDSPLA